MNFIVKFLYQNRFLKPTEKRLNRCIMDSNIDDLQFAQKIGDYRIRLLMIDKLSSYIGESSILNIMIDFIDDKVSIVSKKAISVLLKNSTLIDKNVKKIISEKENYWKEEENKPKPPKRKVKFDRTWKDNEEKMVRLNQVRQQLKKSMYGERWM